MSECKCTMSIRVLGDGCRYCQPQEYIDKLEDWLKEEEQENERLREAIQSLGLRLVETIDGVWGITSDNARISLQKNNLSELEIDRIINEWNR